MTSGIALHACNEFWYNIIIVIAFLNRDKTERGNKIRLLCFFVFPEFKSSVVGGCGIVLLVWRERERERERERTSNKEINVINSKGDSINHKLEH